jgi:hypothetical protein
MEEEEEDEEEEKKRKRRALHRIDWSGRRKMEKERKNSLEEIKILIGKIKKRKKQNIMMIHQFYESIIRVCCEYHICGFTTSIREKSIPTNLSETEDENQIMKNGNWKIMTDRKKTHLLVGKSTHV